jgi:hypothetical protein
MKENKPWMILEESQFRFEMAEHYVMAVGGLSASLKIIRR